MPEVVVMVTTSYPRFPGDSVGTFMEPIAASVAARGHEVHVVAPWHPLVTRAAEEHGVHFHFYKYAPVRALNVFGYAAALRADVKLRGAAYAAAPLALARRLVRRDARRATVSGNGHARPLGGPGGIHRDGGCARPGRRWSACTDPTSTLPKPLRQPAGRRGWSFDAPVRSPPAAPTWPSGPSALAPIRPGSRSYRTASIPNGSDRSRLNGRRSAAQLGVDSGSLLAFSAGRLVRKKGFEHLIDAWALLRAEPAVLLAIAGDGDLRDELRERARAAGVSDRVRFLGNLSQDDVARHLAAADIVVIPSVRDDSGNVDGLPNIVLEALAAGPAVIATAAGGIGTVGRTREDRPRGPRAQRRGDRGGRHTRRGRSRAARAPRGVGAAHGRSPIRVGARSRTLRGSVSARACQQKCRAIEFRFPQ